MANTALTTYKIVGPSSDLQAIRHAIDIMASLPSSTIDNDYGTLWLGCLVNYFGGDWNKICCRGRINEYDLTDEVLTIVTESAWTELREVRLFLERKFPSIKIYYITEVLEDPYCYTNDVNGRFFKYRYAIYNDGLHNIDTEEFLTLNDLTSYVNSHFSSSAPPDVRALQAVIDNYSSSFEDASATIVPFDIIPDTP